MTTIRIYAKQFQTSKGKTFFTYNLFREDKTIPVTKVKTTLDAGNLPIKENGYYLVDVVDGSLQTGVIENNYKHDILWVRKFENVRRDNAFEKYIKEQKQKSVQDFLNSVSVD